MQKLLNAKVEDYHETTEDTEIAWEVVKVSRS